MLFWGDFVKYKLQKNYNEIKSPNAWACPKTDLLSEG